MIESSDSVDVTARPVRVLLVDDDPLVRTGLAMILDRAVGIDVVGEASDGDEAVPEVLSHRPDLVVMDIRMRHVNGIEATRKVMMLPSPPKVLVLTTFDLDEYVFDALETGASGFLLKEASPQEIVHAIRVVAAGESMLSPRSTQRLISHFITTRTNPRRQVARAKLGRLSEREQQIVTAIAQGKTNAEIAEELYVAEATVKTHLTRVFTKLDLTNRVQATIFAYESGLVAP